MYLEISRWFTLAASILMTIGLYDQARKMWCTKSAKDFTLSIVLAIVANELAWCNYGWALREWPIIVITFANIPAEFAVFIGFFKYRRSTKSAL